MAAADYHADPCPEPSLSASLAKTLLSQSAQHCWFQSPRLNPAYQPEEAEKFDRGTAAHAYLLQGATGFSLIEAPDFKTTLARDARDDARARGKTPLLVHRWQEVQEMAEAITRQLAEFEDSPIPLSTGRPEETLIWEEQGIWLRARLDWLHADHRHIDDLKTTSASANPEVWSRTLFGAGYDVQAAMYLRGLKAVMGTEGVFRFLVAENYPPFAMSVIGLAPDARALAERKVNYAITLWRECLERGRWPGYPTVTAWAEAPPWESARWMAQEMGAPMPVGEGIENL